MTTLAYSLDFCAEIGRRAWEDCAREIAQSHGVTLAHVRSRSSCRPHVRARWAVMAMLSSRGMSNGKIGRLLGGLHPSTVHYGLRRHAERTSPALQTGQVRAGDNAQAKRWFPSQAPRVG